MKRNVVSCLILFAISLVDLPVNAQINSLCKGIKTIGRSYVHKIDSEFDVVYQSDLYQFADVTGANPLNTGKWHFHHESAIFKVTKTSCQMVFADPSGDAMTVSDDVPIPVAKAIAMYIAQKRVRIIGRDAIQKEINGPEWLSPELAYAYKRLGFIINPNTKIWKWGDGK